MTRHRRTRKALPWEGSKTSSAPNSIAVVGCEEGPIESSDSGFVLGENVESSCRHCVAIILQAQVPVIADSRGWSANDMTDTMDDSLILEALASYVEL